MDYRSRNYRGKYTDKNGRVKEFVVGLKGGIRRCTGALVLFGTLAGTITFFGKVDAKATNTNKPEDTIDNPNISSEGSFDSVKKAEELIEPSLESPSSVNPISYEELVVKLGERGMHEIENAKNSVMSHEDMFPNAIGDREEITVKDGDTLTSIADEHNMSLEKLEELNPQIQDPDTIYAGDVIVVNNPDGLEKKANEWKSYIDYVLDANISMDENDKMHDVLFGVDNSIASTLANIIHNYENRDSLDNLVRDENGLRSESRDERLATLSSALESLGSRASKIAHEMDLLNPEQFEFYKEYLNQENTKKM